MDDLLRPVKATTSKIRNNIDKFESLTIREGKSFDTKNVLSSKKPRAIIEIDEDGDDVQDVLQPRSTTILGHLEPESTAQLTNITRLQTTSASHRNKRDSTAFLQRTYLPSSDKGSSSLNTTSVPQLVQSKSSDPQPPHPEDTLSPETTITSGKSLVDDAKEILRSQPSRQDLDAVLDYLWFGIKGRHDFNIKAASPQSAQLIHVLVTVTIPDMWPVLDHVASNPNRMELKTESSHVARSEDRTRKMILECLSCAAGLGALLAQIQQQRSQNESQFSKTAEQSALNHHVSARLRIQHLLSVLSGLLHGSKTMLNLLTDTMRIYPDNDMRRKMSWNEIVGFVAGGRILGLAAEALSFISNVSMTEAADASLNQKNDNASNITWLGDGVQFTSWLGRNISFACIKVQVTEKESWKCLTLLLKRGLSLGNREILVSELYNSLLLGKKALWTPLRHLLSSISDYEQKLIFDTILLDISKKYLGGASSLIGYEKDNASVGGAISATAALVRGLIQHNRILQEHLEEWLVVANSSYASVGLATRRALIATLATFEGSLERILERALSNFADKLQIQHGSTLQQDAYTQTILLAIGYLKRSDAAILKSPSITSLVMRSVSNRLAASIPHSRLLGMIVGVANSRAIEATDKVLDFGVEDMETEQVQWWLGIPDLFDTIADEAQMSNLVPLHMQPKSFAIKQQAKAQKIKRRQDPAAKSKIISIEEVTGSENDEEEDDDDLIPYGKPDSDPEDSDDDPTLINRSKASAPVYIIDLIRQLETADKPEVIELALRAAPGLIKRKTGFGTELSDNITTLTTTLVNLQESGFSSHEQYENLRLASIVACILAKPDIIASALAGLYFEGDFSISQRVSLLIALGLAARELAGYETDISINNPTAGETKDTTFPSKQLPPHLQPSQLEQSPQRPLKSLAHNPISALALSQAQSTIQPMALAAADKITGPSVLKIRTFSSRMAVEKRHKEQHEARTRRIPKNLHSLLANFFYLPLCSRMNLLITSSIMTGMRNDRLNTTTLLPSLVRMVLQTLTLILHTLGPSASLHLPTLTHETLLLLGALHASTYLAIDAIVLPALLHLLLALMDVTIEAGHAAQERLIIDHGEQIAELIRWANDLGSKISIPEIDRDDDDGESPGGMPWTVLVAGIQVKWFEMGQRFQGRMLGLMDSGYGL